MNYRKCSRCFPVCSLALAACFLLFAAVTPAGSLEPTDKPGPTMKTLDEVEPRIPISLADLPLSITQPGSYYLTESINYTPTSGHAISIDSDNVTLDLMGFTISGTDATSVNGITAWARHNIEIRNGTVRDFAHGISESSDGSNYRIMNVRSLSNLRRGINLNGTGHTVSGCTVSDNEDVGIFCGENSSVIGSRAVTSKYQGIRVMDNGTVKECTAIDNGSRGIETGRNSSVLDCVVRDNESFGISVGSHSRVIDNTCRANSSSGIVTYEGCVVSGNTVSDSSVIGISVTNGCTVTNNTVFNSGTYGIYGSNSNIITDNTAYGNLGNGIAGQMGCQVSRNTVRNNKGHGIYVDHNCTVTWNNCYNNGLNGDGAGIRASSGNRIESNQLTENDRGIELDSDKNLVVKNTARDNTILWTQRITGNKVAPWAPDPASAGPWDNFSF